ncbi:MAG: arsenate reductase (glutaredoxin) [Gammaproteobacteria bacterium]
MKATIYHNPRCSKSRATKALLEDNGVDLEIVEYLKTPPSEKTLESLAALLAIPAKSLVRTGEAAFQEAGVDLESATNAEIFALLANHPSVLQRPIVRVGDRARIGRPPDAVLELLE